MKATSRELRTAREWPGPYVMRLAQTKGITLTHALLALHDGGLAPVWVPILERLVQQVRGTLLLVTHQDGQPDCERYFLLAVTSKELPYDRARGYAPLAVTSHWVWDVPVNSDDNLVDLRWSNRKPHTGVAAHSALVEYQP